MVLKFRENEKERAFIYQGLIFQAISGSLRVLEIIVCNLEKFKRWCAHPFNPNDFWMIFSVNLMVEWQGNILEKMK